MVSNQKFAVEAQESLNNGVAASRNHSAALEEVWRTRSKQLLRVTQRITNNREDAEDALQESFLRAHVSMHNFDGRSSIATWLTRIAINSALMILRKRSGGLQVLSIGDNVIGGGVTALNPADQSPSPEANYADLERQVFVRQAIGALPPSIREALELQTQERSTKEIAEKMGLSISAAKSRIFRAKSALQKSLQQRERKFTRASGATKQMQLSPA